MPTLTLAIETSNPASSTESSRCGVALGRTEGVANELVDVEFLRDTDRHSDDLMPAIKRLLRRAGHNPEQLERVAVSAGPGGFTSVRIAVVTAKMIARASGASCVAVPSAHVVAASVADGGGRFGVALAGKADTAHVTCFDQDGRPASEGVVLDADGLEGLGLSLLVADRHLPAPMRERCGTLGAAVIEPSFDPAACLEISASYPDVAVADLLPIYPREPEAVRIWRERHSG